MNLNQYIDGDITDRTFAKWVQQGGMENALDFETHLEHREERFVNRKMKFGEKARIERVRGIERILSSLQKDFPHLGRLDVEPDEGQELHFIEDAFIQAHRDYLEIQLIVENWEQTYPGFVLPTEYRESPTSTDFSKRFWEIEDIAKKGTEYLNSKLKKMEDEEVSLEVITQVKEHTVSPQDYPHIENYKRYLDEFCDSLVKKYREEEAIERLEELKRKTRINPPTLLGDQTNLTERLIEWYIRAEQDQQTALRIVEEKIESHKLNEFHHDHTGDGSGVYIRDLVIPKYSNFDERKYAAKVDKKFRELTIKDQIRISSSHGIKMPTFHRGIPKIESRKDVIEWYEMAGKHKIVCEKGRSEFTEAILQKFGEWSDHYQDISKISIDYTNLKEDTNLGEVSRTFARLILLERPTQTRLRFHKSKKFIENAKRLMNTSEKGETVAKPKPAETERRKKDEPFNPFSPDAIAQHRQRLEKSKKASQKKKKKEKAWFKNRERDLKKKVEDADTKKKKADAKKELAGFLKQNKHKY